jgi:hypothetical protein
MNVICARSRRPAHVGSRQIRPNGAARPCRQRSLRSPAAGQRGAAGVGDGVFVRRGPRRHALAAHPRAPAGDGAGNRSDASSKNNPLKPTWYESPAPRAELGEHSNACHPSRDGHDHRRPMATNVHRGNHATRSFPKAGQFPGPIPPVGLDIQGANRMLGACAGQREKRTQVDMRPARFDR